MRREVFASIAILLANWPRAFVGAAASASMWQSCWTKWSTELPFWLNDVVRGRLSREKYKVSDGEIASVVNYLKSHGLPATITTVGNLLGSREWARKVPERRRLLG
jgi:hypothetical protein